MDKLSLLRDIAEDLMHEIENARIIHQQILTRTNDSLVKYTASLELALLNRISDEAWDIYKILWGNKGGDDENNG